MAKRKPRIPHDIRAAPQAAAERREAEASSEAISAARAFGVDIDQLRESLKRTPDERLRELEANAAFLSVLQSSATVTKRGDSR